MNDVATRRAVALVGSLDTKGDEYAYVAGRLRGAGVDPLVIDTGVRGAPGMRADITRSEVARAGGRDIDELTAIGDRGQALDTMTRGAAVWVADLYRQGRIQGGLALGGTGGTAVASEVFRVLPIGVPKLIVSTAASGDTAVYVGESDLVLFPSVVDIAGLNRISRPILANAAAAMAGMVLGDVPPREGEKPLIAASMFGVTTDCVTRARERLTRLGYEVIVFHMVGSGGRAMEGLIRDGFFAGVLDITTTELADEMLGGVFSAGTGRLTAAAELGVPQVVSVGALDMVNFGPMDSVPPQWAGRTLHRHNTSVTLLRTNAQESDRLGSIFAQRLADAGDPTCVLLPLGGVSAIDVPGGPFHDEAANGALFAAIHRGLAGSSVRVKELNLDINHPAFADAAADLLHAAITARAAQERT